jgi:curved DNA-binding protein CbpA
MKRPTNDFWNALNELDQKLGSISYYELLGVQASVDVDAIRGSYERQVRVVHPDRHARESDAGRKQSLTRIYARIGEAYRILSHPQRRAEYDRSLLAGKLRYEEERADHAPHPQEDPHHPQAKSLFEQAQTLLKQNDKKAARAKLQLAKQYQPDSKAIADAIAQCGSPTPPPPADPAPVPGTPVKKPALPGSGAGTPVILLPALHLKYATIRTTTVTVKPMKPSPIPLFAGRANVPAIQASPPARPGFGTTHVTHMRARHLKPAMTRLTTTAMAASMMQPPASRVTMATPVPPPAVWGPAG